MTEELPGEQIFGRLVPLSEYCNIQYNARISLAETLQSLRREGTRQVYCFTIKEHQRLIRVKKRFI